MKIKLGVEQVSIEQVSMLSEAITALEEGATSHAVSLLREAITDEDILSGEESLHPDWLDIYSELSSRPSAHRYARLLEEVKRLVAHLLGVDEEVQLVDPKTENIVFLLGAGASKPEPSGIPTVKELLPDMLARARRLDREDVNRLADFCVEKKIENIEDLLTSAQLAEYCSQNPNVLNLVDFLLFGNLQAQEERRVFRRPRVDFSSVLFLQDTLQVLFGLLSSRMLPAKPNAGHLAIADYVKGNSKSSIVTTNYDCCMDLALLKDGHDLNYQLDFTNDQGGAPKSGTRLIKLHGSLNWFFCETCQKVHLIDINTTVQNYLNDIAFYPVIAVCKECGGQRRGLLVPPLAMKFDIFPSLNSLLERAEDALSEASIVAVVGFSFSDADLYISRMLSKWLSTNEKSRMIIFDPDVSVVEKVTKQFELRIQNFDKRRVLSVYGDCAETLPKFLNGDFISKEMKDDKGNI
ncbi:MAG: SIR2 family protein [Anaerolineales bacterium]|nr:MAG: SIR2 family protein [Anaerolineales bacterium]